MSTSDQIVGACAFTYEGRTVYWTENMDIGDDVPALLQAWRTGANSVTIKGIPFVVVMGGNDGLVAVNPDGAVSLVCGTGKGVWFVAVFATGDADKYTLLKECVQAAKNIEVSVSVFDV